MAEPLVSVCIPTYNRAEFLEETIESVLAQTFTDYEIVISDNCSTDNTEEVVQKYVANGHNIRYQRSDETVVACSNINRSLLLAEGKYIKLLFSDDKLAPACLEKFVDIMEKNPNVSLVTSYSSSNFVQIVLTLSGVSMSSQIRLAIGSRP